MRKAGEDERKRKAVEEEQYKRAAEQMERMERKAKAAEADRAKNMAEEGRRQLAADSRTGKEAPKEAPKVEQVGCRIHTEQVGRKNKEDIGKRGEAQMIVKHACAPPSGSRLNWV